MVSDAPPGMPLDAGSSISISLSGDDEATLRRYWDGLVEGGSVTMPLERAPWGDTFGMCADRFGINWMVNIAGVPATSP
jgi:PhnB protein